MSMTMPIYQSDAESCAACPHAVDGAVIDGREYPQGWHCDVCDVAGNTPKGRERFAICREPGAWEAAR